jgi:precorrin-6B methylase 1
MTGPALNLIGYIFKNKKELELMKTIEENKYRILILVNEKVNLLRLANSLTKKQKTASVITAMHLSKSDELHAFNVEEIEKESFDPILNLSNWY